MEDRRRAVERGSDKTQPISTHSKAAIMAFNTRSLSRAAAAAFELRLEKA